MDPGGSAVEEEEPAGPNFPVAQRPLIVVDGRGVAAGNAEWGRDWLAATWWRCASVLSGGSPDARLESMAGLVRPY